MSILLTRATTTRATTKILKHNIQKLVSAHSRPLSSAWSDFPLGPPDPIIGLNEAFAKDDSPQKVNVGVGAYRGDDGKPYVLQCVRDAEAIIQNSSLDHEYSGITGDAKFVSLALKFAYGDDCKAISEDRVAGVQSLSGTGGLRVFGELMAKFGHRHIYVPNPTWGNHIPIFTNAGLEVRKYRYYDSTTSSLDFENLKTDIEAMPEQSIVLLHACAHNPTGMDPTLDQWAELSQLIKRKNLLPFFDCAYQGFASGSASQDAAALRHFVNEGQHDSLALVQSFSKNFGLYGQRIGALSIVAPDANQANNVLSQMKMCIRPMYSNPPRHGARIVSTILSDTNLTQDFTVQCREMADRISTMRVSLRSVLEDDLKSKHSWEHITNQIGMFAYSGLTKAQVELMRDRHHIYCTLDGRISMAGVTSGNVKNIANAIHDVTNQ